MELKAWTDRNLKGDPVIWGIIFLLSIISIAVVYSAIGSLAYKKMQGNTEYYLVKHSVLVLVGLVLMWLAHKVDYKYYSGISKLALWMSLPLLVLTFFIGSNINEAQGRWLVIPIINQSFQPSDFAKLALITRLASMLAKRQANIDDFKESFIPIVLWSGGICGVIALSNLSTAIILFATCLLIMFIGRVPMKFIGMLIIVGLLSVTAGLAAGSRLGTMIKRVSAFWNGMNGKDADIPYQLQQGYVAIASGGLTGNGPGQSIHADFLPHAYSDFIFAVIIEEYGMIGGILVLILYLALLYRGMLIVARSDRAFGGLLSAGLTFSLVIQAMINMGVAVGLGPVTGQPLPLVSMGGTSMLFTGISLGIILSVSRGDISEDSSISNENKNVAKKQTEESDN
jgi:cell division protein FtsW